MPRQGELINVGLGDASNREIIHWMANLNQILPEEAAKEFRYDSAGNITGFLFEKPLEERSGTPEGVDRWAKERGFGAKWPSYEDSRSLIELVTAVLGRRVARRNAQNIELARQLPQSVKPYRVNDGIHDHIRILTEKGRRAYIGFTTAPYISLESQALLDLADSLRDMGLVVRMGRAADDWYGANSFPVMVWNPERIIYPETHAALNP